jgi:hypothetical protein
VKVVNDKILFQQSEELRKKHNELVNKYNEMVNEKKQLIRVNLSLAGELKIKREDLKLLKPYVGQLIMQITEGWPNVLSGIGDSIDISNPPNSSLIFLKTLLDNYEKLIVAAEHDRNDEIALMYLIGIASYKYVSVSSISEKRSTVVLDSIVHYLNINSEYGKCEHHSLTKHYDERYHTCDEEVATMEKIFLMGFVVKDRGNDVILKKAICTK